MEPTVLVGFTAAAAAMVVLPGPDWALVVAAGVRARDDVVPTVGGLALGYAALTGTVAAGVAPVVAAAPGALVALTVGGAAYLIHVGGNLLRQSPPRRRRPPTTAPLNRRGLLVRGMGVSMLNPKALLFFLAFLPQFADPGADWPVIMQLLTLGGVWVALIAVFYTILGRSAAHTFAGRPEYGEVLTRVVGAAMVVAGLALLVEPLVR